MEDNSFMDKVTLLDHCVDGEETRFDNLIGKDYDKFNIIYEILANNTALLSSNISCNYITNYELEVRIPIVNAKSVKVVDIVVPGDKMAGIDTYFDGGYFVLNISVKEGW